MAPFFFGIQEELQSVAQESLKADKDRLDREVMRLQQDVEEWKVSIHATNISLTLEAFTKFAVNLYESYEARTVLIPFSTIFLTIAESGSVSYVKTQWNNSTITRPARTQVTSQTGRGK